MMDTFWCCTNMFSDKANCKWLPSVILCASPIRVVEVVASQNTLEGCGMKIRSWA
jgi:hypothetical protein